MLRAGGVVDPRSGRLTVRVRDTGIGIPRDQISKIFGRFERAESGAARRFGGTGLGLAIVKELVKLFGGEVSVESEAGHGTEFTVVIPMKTAVAAAPELAPDRASGAHVARAIRLLLADDMEDNRFLVKSYLAGQEVSVVEACNGREAVNLAKGGSFDLILMDIQMPEMDGLEAARLIRAHERADGLKAVPIVALTAFALPEEIARTSEAGCNAHLTKPVRKRMLIEKINSVLLESERSITPLG